jgi:hypothetical protein
MARFAANGAAAGAAPSMQALAPGYRVSNARSLLVARRKE